MVYRIYAVTIVARTDTPWRAKDLSIYIGHISSPSIGKQNDLFRITDSISNNYQTTYLNNFFKFQGRYFLHKRVGRGI